MKLLTSQVNPQVIDEKKPSPLDEVLRQGARDARQDTEVAAYIETHQHEVDVVVQRSRPRAHPRQRRGSAEDPGTPTIAELMSGANFSFRDPAAVSAARKAFIPWLYLKGISTGDFSEALEALLGPDAPGLSATTVVRLKDVWRREYEAWSQRDLSGQPFGPTASTRTSVWTMNGSVYWS